MTLRVNHAALTMAMEDIKATVRQIDGRLDNLESELSKLKADWHGEAQQAYLVAKAEWDGAIQEMNVLLDSVGTSVNTSNLDYMAADKRGAAQFGDIRAV